MSTSTHTITAELHPHHLADARMRRERERIAARYAPSTRELFAHREAIADGADVLTTPAQERAYERRARRAKLRAEAAIALAGLAAVGTASQRAAQGLSAFSDAVRAMFGGAR